jgi:hypothetical protein
MKPHIYMFHGRWAWTVYGKVKAEGASLLHLQFLYYEAEGYVKRKNRKLGGA